MAARTKVRQPDFARFTRAEAELVEEIVHRALAMYRKAAIDADYLALRMNLSAVHARTPLRLRDLLEADDFNFSHDIDGIARNLNRETGDLDNCFLPRFARRGEVT